jgi:hypothetical protein
MGTPVPESITVQRIKPTGTDQSALHIEPAQPDRLRVIQVIPHGIHISFDAENRSKLRAWCDAQDARESPQVHAAAALRDRRIERALKRAASESKSKAPLHAAAIAEGMRLAEKEFSGAASGQLLTRQRLASMIALAFTLGAAYRGLK